MRIQFYALLIATILCVSCQRSPKPSEVWPTKAWLYSSAEEQGMDGTLLASLDRKISNGDYGYVDHMLVIRNGYIVYDQSYLHDYEQISTGYDTASSMYNYYDPEWHPFYNRTKLHSLQSVTKSVTSALFGIAFRRHELQDIKSEVIPYFSGFEIRNMDDLKQQISLEDLLTMRAGFDWEENIYAYTDPRNNCAQMEKSSDWVQYVLDRPMAEKPGKVFVYNSGASQLLSHLMKKFTGLHVDEYAKKYLFSPLGIREFYWKRTPTELPDTEGGLYLKPHDLAKIGDLYLRKGIWNGQQILPKEWIELSLKPYTKDTAPESDAWNMGYGYQWWLLPHGESYAYTMLGYGGQRLIASPEADLLAVFTGWNIFNREPLPVNVIVDSILNAVTDNSKHR